MLKSENEILELADNLSMIASEISDRAKKLLEENKLPKDSTHKILEKSSAIRKIADFLYIDAIEYILDDISESQGNLKKATQDISETIKKIKKVEQFLDLTSDILVFATAVAARKPGPIISSLNEIRKDISEIA